MKPSMNARRPHGFSLIELMVAMTIGMILTLLIGQIFINSKQVFSSTDNLGRLQENARFALGLLTRELRSSTYKSDPRAPRATVFPIGTAPSLMSIDGGTTVPDTLMVAFQGSGNGTGTADGTVQDCVGARVDSGALVVNTFFIQNDAANANEPTLYCSTAAPTSITPTSVPAFTKAACVAATCFPLIPGVENMQILYGEDTSGPPPATLSPDGSIDRWVTAANVSNWDNVLSVRISLLLRTPDRIADTTNTATYPMSGTSVSAPGTDTRLRRVFTTVVNLRNRTQ